MMRRLLMLGFLISTTIIVSSFGSSVLKSSSGGDLVELNEDNWELMLKGEWMVEFYAPWCPACKNLSPTWERFATGAADLMVNVAKIDVTKSPSLSGRFFVTALPTIYHVKNGDFRQYRGSRDDEAFMSFIKYKQWKDTAKISSWKKPDTIHMSILSYFFKLSHTLKDLNTRLQEDYGLPTWGSYAFFAIGTIFVGAALGLLLVCVVDFLYPPKKSQRQSFSVSKDKPYNAAVEDLANEELEDDANPQNAEDGEDDNDNDDDDDDEEEDDDDDDDNEVVEEDPSTSEGEKIIQTESDQSESEKTKDDKSVDKKMTMTDNNQTAEKKSSPAAEVRKRKSRKAD